MFNLFGKLWLKGVKRLIKAQSTETARQRKLHDGMRKAAGKAASKATAKATAASSTAVKKAVKKAVRATSKAADRPATKTGKKRQAQKAGAGARTGSTRGAANGVGVQQSSTALDAGGSWRQVYQSSPAAVGSTKSRRLGGWLFVPARAGDVAGPPMPLVVMLHGCGQTAPVFATGTRMNQLAVRYGFAVLYPQQSLSAHAQRCWPWYRRSLQEGGDELALIAGMIERTCARQALDTNRVYAAGLSAGAALAHNLALRRPDLIAAVALHSGPVHGAADSRMSAFAVMQHGTRDALGPIARLQRERGGQFDMPSLIIQGEQDQVVRPVNATQLFRQCCEVNGLDIASASAPLTRRQRPDCDAYRVVDVKRGRRTLVRLVEVAHLAHAWSGGDPSLRYNAAQGPDASALLWAFFRRHARNAAEASALPSAQASTVDRTS